VRTCRQLCQVCEVVEIAERNYAFLFDLVLKRDGRLRTELDLLVRRVFCIY
jgi:hypothetical protein